jgi:NTP pyrophosphatase (non-canonical NTP hydrolase)
VADVDLDDLAVRLREFAAARAWEQFHTPKNLAMALAGEVGELAAELQWLTPEEADRVMGDPEAAAQMRSELGDVTIYLVRLAHVLGVDLVEAARVKLEEGERRYDVETYWGSVRKAPPLS